jgi:hypothetical protein
MPPLTQIKDAEADLSYVNYVEEALSLRDKKNFSQCKKRTLLGLFAQGRPFALVRN